MCNLKQQISLLFLVTVGIIFFVYLYSILLSNFILEGSNYMYFKRNLTNIENLRKTNFVVETTKRNSSYVASDQVNNQKIIFEYHSECMEVRKPQDTDIRFSNIYWQVLETAEEFHLPMYIADALYDNRSKKDSAPCVRLFTVTPRTIPVRYRYSPNLRLRQYYCYFWHPDKNEAPLVVQPNIKWLDGRKRFIVNNTLYGQYLFTCRLPEPGMIFSDVSLVAVFKSPTDTKCTNNVTNLMPILYPEHSENWKHEFGMCVMISYGTVSEKDVHWVIEWFEFNNLLGISEINIYNGTLKLHPLVKKVFDYYEKRGLLVLTQQPPPFGEYPPNEFKYAAKTATRSALNDCMYRNMYNYQFMVVVDMDEVIVPEKHDNYTQLMQYLRNMHNNNRPVRFGNKGYYLEYPQDTTQPKILRTQQYRYHAPTGADPMRRKSMINPRFCKVSYAHWCLTKLNMEHKNITTSTLTVGSTLAASHHYRKTCYSQNNPKYWNHERCDKIEKMKTLDTKILRFKDKLLARVMDVHTALNIPVSEHLSLRTELEGT